MSAGGFRVTFCRAASGSCRARERLRERLVRAAGSRPGRTAGRHVAGVQQDDWRLLQVPLARPAADHGQDRRSEEPAHRDVQGRTARGARRDLHVRHRHVVAREPARPHEHRLLEDERCRQGEGSLAARRSRFALSWIKRDGNGRVFYRRTATPSGTTRSSRCSSTCSPACSTRSAISRPTTARV